MTGSKSGRTEASPNAPSENNLSREHSFPHLLLILSAAGDPDCFLSFELPTCNSVTSFPLFRIASAEVTGFCDGNHRTFSGDGRVYITHYEVVNAFGCWTGLRLEGSL